MENSLGTAVHRSDHLESLLFLAALELKMVLFSLRGALSSDPACERPSGDLEDLPCCRVRPATRACSSGDARKMKCQKH
eukprot:COSAG02_NODE_1543_length_12003_cov_16.681536_12_plen_79_part_00